MGDPVSAILQFGPSCTADTATFRRVSSLVPLIRGSTYDDVGHDVLTIVRN